MKLKAKKRDTIWLEELIAKAGSQVKLAKLLSVNQNVVSMWRKKGVTIERALFIASKTGYLVEKIRPDIYVGFKRIKIDR